MVGAAQPDRRSIGDPVAQDLIRKWRLATLQIRLDLSEGNTSVVAEVLAYGDESEDDATTLWNARYPLSSFGLKGTKTPKRLVVPEDLGAAVDSAVRDAEVSRLWLRLIPPYGYLGAVPWESATAFPMIRVPDRLPAPAELGRVWRTVIVVSAAPGSSWAAPYIDSFSSHLDKWIGGSCEIDVFADKGTVSALQRFSLPKEVRVHNPSYAKVAVQTRASKSRSSTRVVPVSGQLWPAWIAAGLRGQAVRAVHVVLDGAFDQNRPLLTMHPDPERPVSRAGCAFVTGDEVRSLADTVGADVLSFGSSPDNPTDVATRMIADEVGQMRAGTTLYSSLTVDADGRRLAEAHATVRNRTGSWPPDPSMFAYVQPELVETNAPHGKQMSVATRGKSAVDFESAAVDLEPNTNLEGIYRDSEVVPSWVAAADRYLGNQVAGLVRQSDSEVPTAHIKGAYNKGAADALEMIRDIVDRNAGPA
jgi:hypothetical protein